MIATSMPRAVITGIGLVTPLGRSLDEFFSSVCAPGSGLVRPPEGHFAAELVQAVGIAPQIDPFDVVPRTDANVADRFALMAVAAADDAIADAGIKIGEDVDPLRVAAVISTGAGGMETFEAQATIQHARGTDAVSPYLFAGFLPNMATARVVMKYGIRGPSYTITTACAASAHAVADALRLIQSGDADVVVCGGTEASLGPTGLSGFRNAHALATGWDDPEAASRPFDRRRNGFVLGEGGGVLVVERADLAEARGGSGYADLIGWGATSDAYHLVMPRPDGGGAADAMRVALHSAGAVPCDVQYLNAHATGTRIGDLAEAKAIQTVFGSEQPLVSSTKGVMGHLLGGAGVVEAAVTVMAVASGQVPPTKNLEEPDGKCDLNHVRGQAIATPISLALSNSFAFGGHNVTLAFGQPSTKRRRSVPSTSETL